jgi:hypothetical protein
MIAATKAAAAIKKDFIDQYHQLVVMKETAALMHAHRNFGCSKVLLLERWLALLPT